MYSSEKYQYNIFFIFKTEYKFILYNVIKEKNIEQL